MGKRGTVEERFWRYVKRGTDDECWIWGGAESGGYGRLNVGGRTDCAHRVAYEILVGPIPDGLELDHDCRNRLCCNPRHLKPMTGWENRLRSDNPFAANARKTHCKHGHEFDEKNTAYTQDGRRYCRACARDTARDSYAKKRSLASAR